MGHWYYGPVKSLGNALPNVPIQILLKVPQHVIAKTILLFLGIHFFVL